MSALSFSNAAISPSADAGSEARGALVVTGILTGIGVIGFVT
jgi:hypothetical protein